MMGMCMILIPCFTMLLVILGSISFWATRYKKVGSDEVMIIYGRKKLDPMTGEYRGYRLIRDGGVFVFPIVEDYKAFQVSMITLNLSDFTAYDKYNKPLIFDIDSRISFQNNDMSLRKAVDNLLDKSSEEIEKITREILECYVNQVCGDYSEEEIIYMDKNIIKKQIEDYSYENFSSLGMKIELLNINGIKEKVF